MYVKSLHAKENYSRASKARWAKKTPEERSEQMKQVALKKWSKTSTDDRRKHSLKMLNAKRKRI